MSDLQIFNTSAKDYEYIGLRFNDKHCEELGLFVVSPSGLTQESLFGEFEDTIVEVSGREGAYYFGTIMKPKRATLSFAFDNMTSQNKRDIISWLSPKRFSKLILDQLPYKYHWAKVAAPPTFSFVPFEQNITLGKQHIFKGTLDVEFLATDPYGYSEYALVNQVPIWNGDPIDWTLNKPYTASNLPGWFEESGLHDVAPTPDLAYANSASGYAPSTAITAGALTPNFYNAGNIEVSMSFTVTVPVFNIGSTFQFKNTSVTPEDIFTLESLKHISALSTSTGFWKIICDPSKGLITGSNSVDGVTNFGPIYNLGALHNGVWLKAYPGTNMLHSSHNLKSGTQAFSISYKYKYL